MTDQNDLSLLEFIYQSLDLSRNGHQELRLLVLDKRDIMMYHYDLRHTSFDGLIHVF